VFPEVEPPPENAVTSLHCPVDLDVEALRDAVALTYDRLAREPHGEFHFHVGRAYAVERLGYDDAALAGLPQASLDAFAGVANPHLAGSVVEGDRVLDLGCGGGLDLLLAARRVGPRGRAIGVDATPSMCARAAAAAVQAGLADRVTVLEGRVEDLPLEDESVDVVQSNGVLNLVPEKMEAFREIARVLQPGGRLHLGAVVIEGTFSTSGPPEWRALCRRQSSSRRRATPASSADASSPATAPSRPPRRAPRWPSTCACRG